MPFSSPDPASQDYSSEIQGPLYARESSPQDDDQLEGLFSLLHDLELEVSQFPAAEPASPPPPPPATNGAASTSPPAATRQNFDLEQDFWQAPRPWTFEGRRSELPWGQEDKTNSRSEATLLPFSDQADALPPFSAAAAPDLLPDEDEGEDEGGDEAALEQLRDLLSDLLIGEGGQQVGELTARLQQLEQQIRDPQGLSDLLLPLLVSLLERKVQDAPEEVIQALLPIVDRAIARKSQTDKTAMSLALAAALPGALSKQIGDAPEEVIQALAPVMGRALREQVRLERDAMVDALYPVIGNTVSKYMGEVVRQINQRVEETFSLRGLARKLRARLRGVSEAELILSEAMPFSVQAIFLIHKASGLVMVEVQRDDQPELEADMLAGMLTAIRSFASECTVNPEKTSELTEVDYDDFKIVMEVAGYCYIAAVTQGDPPASFANQLRQVLSAIILNYGYGDLIAAFDGDPDSIPSAVHELLADLLHSPEATIQLRQQGPAQAALDQPRWSRSVLAAWGVLLSLLALPFVIYGWQQAHRQHLANRVSEAITADPQLAVYQVRADVVGSEVRVQGKLPSEILSQHALAIAATSAPEGHDVVDQIQRVHPPPDPALIQTQVDQQTLTLNQLPGVQISSRYEVETNRVIVEGSIQQGQNAQIATQAFAQIPGVASVILALATDQPPIQRRIYFDTNSTFIDPYDLESKLMPIRNFLQQSPDVQLRITGHTDRSGSEQRNRRLAPQRAEVVRQALVANGIDPDRLQTDGSTDPPPNVSLEDPLWLSRTVRFEQISPTGAN